MKNIYKNCIFCLVIDKIFIINNEVENDEFSKVTLNLAKPKNIELLIFELTTKNGLHNATR